MDDKPQDKPANLEDFMKKLSQKLSDVSEKKRMKSDDEATVIGSPIAKLSDEDRQTLSNAKYHLMRLEDTILEKIAQMNLEYVQAVRQKNDVSHVIETKYGLLGRDYRINLNTGDVQEVVRHG